MQKMELLAPAGNMNKLKIAFLYGADAVYLGGKSFGLRAFSDNFSPEEMREAVTYAHSIGKKIHVTVNIFPHNDDLTGLPEYLRFLRDIHVDALLIADPGIFNMARELVPEVPIHISTQANTTNWSTVDFWHKLGASRVVMAREVSLKDVAEIHRRVPDIELEGFVHGAMCISYSGRCLLSNFMIERDANRGMCAHPCRWKYSLVEEKRPGEYYPVEEDERGTYILNSRDLCMIEHLDKIVESGIMSAKVEGRMKSVFYVATVIHAYRQAIDAYFADPARYEFKAEWLTELKKVSHREFTTGFYFDKPTNQDQNYQTSAYTREYSFVGIVKSYDSATGYAVVEQRNKMTLGDEIEVFGPDIPFFKQALESMYDAESGEPLESAPHPQQVLRIKMDQPVKENYILRKAIRRSEI